MPQEELEYRAKLVELIYARETQDHLLQSFERQGRQNSPAPHAAANWRVIHDLRNTIEGCRDQCDLTALPSPSISGAAERLLREHSEHRMGAQEAL